MGRPLALVLALAARLLAQEATFRTGISIVEIDAQVVDDNGVVEGLTRDSFLVKDNGQAVSLRYCAREERPLDLILLFETTRMMAPNAMKLRGAAETAISAIQPGDRVGAMSFSESVHAEIPLTADLQAVRQRLRFGLAYAMFAGKPYVLPAVVETAKCLAGLPAPHGRRAILAFSANAGFGVSNQSHLGVARALWNVDTILSGVVIPSSWTRFTYDDNPYRIFGMISAGINRSDDIDEVAQQTGGETIYLENAGPMRSPAEPYVEVRRAIQRMRRRYMLYYDMPESKPGERRRVSIELTPSAQGNHPGARVNARKGYVVPKREALP
jgi:VWFA-related protein